MTGAETDWDIREAILFYRLADVRLGKDCWEWKGAVNHGGYGHYSGRTLSTVGRRVNYVAHRASWEITMGAIPDGLLVCHRCDNPPCVNPDHLFLGTHADNMEDMVRKGRKKRGENHSRARLAESDVLRIRELVAKGGLSQAAIGELFGISGTHVGNIALRNKWKHVK